MPAIAPIIGNVAINLGIAIGASLLQAAISGATKTGVTTSKGLTFEMETGEAAPVTCLLGGGRTRGQLVYINEYGTDNEYLQLVIKCAHGYHEPMEAFLADDKVMTLSGNNSSSRGRVVNEYQVSGTPYMWAKYYDGAPGQAADAELIARATNNRWGTFHKLTGCAYMIVTLRFNADVYATSGGRPPSFSSVWGPLKVYDWRKDSTAGGVGTQRWGQPATYAGSRNPVVLRYNYRRGIYVSGVRILGQGYASWSVDRDAYTAEANVCDEDIFDPVTNTTYKRYEFGREVGDDEEKLSVLAELDAAYCGASTRRGGADVPLSAKQEVSLGTLTDGMRLKGRPVSANKRGTVSGKATCWHGQFVSANDNYTAVPFTARVDAALETSLGGRVSRKVDQGFERLQARAQARAEIELRKQRYPATRVETFGPGALKYEVGDVITRACEWGNTLMRIVGRAPTDNLAGVTLTMRQWSNVIVPASGDSFVELPSGPGPGAINPTRLVTIPNLQAFQYSQIGGGAVHPAIRFTWDEIVDQTVDQIIIRVWPSDGDELQDGKTFFGTRFNRAILATGLAPQKLYSYRGTITCTPYRATLFTSIGSITTPVEQIPVGEGVIDLSALTAQIQAALNSVITISEGSVQAQIDALRDEFEQLAAVVSDGAVAFDRRYTELKARTDQATASISEEQIVRIDATQAIAQNTRIVQAQFQSSLDTATFNSASVTSQIQAVATAQSAAATSLEVYKVQVGNNFSGVNSRVDVVVSDQGSTAGSLSSFLSQFGGNSAGVQTAINAATSTANSASSSISTYLSQFSGNSGTVQSRLQTITNTIGSSGEIFQSVQAMASDATAGGRFKIGVKATSANSATATAEMLIRAGTTGSYTSVGFMANIYGDGSADFIVVAPKFVVTNAGINQYAHAMTFSGSTLTLDDLKVTRIQSLDGTTVDFNLGSTGGAPYLQFG